MAKPDRDTIAEQEAEARFDEYCTRTYLDEPCRDASCPVHGDTYEGVPT
jgi:hypothetical protein